MTMKIRAVLASVLGLSAFAVLGYGQAASPSPTPTPPPNIPASNNAIGGPTGGSTGTTPRPRAHVPHANQHPAIRAAIRNLERAVVDLQNAAHDFGGHREDAINACNAAIAQLQLALQYAGATTGSGGSTPTPTPAP
jgi:hypothetical protein